MALRERKWDVGKLEAVNSRNSDTLQYLSLIAGQSAPAAGTEQPTAKQQRDKPRVLIVDDEPENLDLMRRCLRGAYEVETASSGEEGLELVRRGEFELIISDQRMPGMSGAEFLAQTLALRPTSVRMIVTAYADVDAVADAVNEAQIAGYIRKPFSAADLTGAISRATRLRALTKPGASDDRSADMFRRILTEAPSGIAVVRDDNVLFANPAMCRLWNVPEDLSLGVAQACARLDTSDAVRFKECITAVAESPDRPRSAQRLRFRSADGAVMAEMNALPLELTDGRAVVLHAWTTDRDSPLLAQVVSTVATDGQRPRILFVDDQTLLLAAVRRAYRSYYDVVTAANGQEALRILEQDDAFDLVICDVDMPEPNGIHLLGQLELRRSALVGRVVFMTGNPDHDLDSSLPSTVLPCLRKPFDLEAVHKLVEASKQSRGTT